MILESNLYNNDIFIISSLKGFFNSTLFITKILSLRDLSIFEFNLKLQSIENRYI